MIKKKNGFTLVELLVVIAIISVLASILIPSLGKVTEKANRAAVKNTITQLSTALKAYETDYGEYPPDDETGNGGSTTTGTYKYRNDILVKYLDGDTGNGGPSIVYFEFPEEYLSGGSKKLVLLDRFGESFWYHNFHDDTGSTGKVRNAGNPLHPWFNRFNFRGYQLYSEANYPNAPYGDKTGENGVTADDFKWITNYSR